MKIILLEDVEDVGKKFEVKEVKNGHARNFLIPKNLAKPATKKNLQWLETQKEAMEKVAEEDLKRWEELASKIDGVEVPIAVKVGKSNELFESINAQKIAEKMKEMGYGIKKSHIKLDDAIKAIGEFPVKVVLDHNLEAEIKVIVSAQTEEKEEI